MNVSQLEKILEHIDLIEILIGDNNAGTYNIVEEGANFKAVVINELKGLVWVRYLQERKQK